MNYHRSDSPEQRRDTSHVNNFDSSRWDISNNDYVDYQRGRRVVQQDNVNFQSPDGRQYFHIDHATFIMGGNWDQRRFGGRGQAGYYPDWDDRPSYRDMTYQSMLRQQQIRPYDGDYRYGDPSQWTTRPVYREPRWDYDRGYRQTGYNPRIDGAWANGVGVISSGGSDDGYYESNPLRRLNQDVVIPVAQTAAGLGVLKGVWDMFTGRGRGNYNYYGSGWGGNQWGGNQWGGNQWGRGWGSGFGWG